MLITKEYCKQLEQLHTENVKFGGAPVPHENTDFLIEICNRLNTWDVLDYGCGKGLLAKSLPFPIKEYDPAILGKTQPPEPADFVWCGDVLEHIEPECLDAVLQDLARVIKWRGYLLIHIGPAHKFLPDGRNAHLIQKSPTWWLRKLLDYFTIERFSTHNTSCQIAVHKLIKEVL